MITNQEMEAEIRRLAHFRHGIHLPYDLRTAKDSWVENLVDHAFPALLEASGYCRRCAGNPGMWLPIKLVFSQGGASC